MILSRPLACLAAVACLLLAGAQVPPPDPFQRFQVPEEWTKKFWSDPAVVALLDRPVEEIARLVPTQAGFRFARCPACGVAERDNPLQWSIADPEHLTCRRCKAVLPNEKIPSHADNDPNKPIPEEKVVVGPEKTHSYPYHVLASPHARYPGERVYLGAKRDYEARLFLSKLAVYAALAHRDGGPCPQGDPRAARLAATLILRFSQVYPAYAVHFDQPDQPKFLQPADLRPPYRNGYQSGKWDWSGAWNVPLDLVVAYGLLRDHPALAEAAKALNDPADPAARIEEGFLRPAAEFVLGHPDPGDELSIHAARGLLAVGRLLNERRFIDSGLGKLDEVARRAFYHDGTWRDGSEEAQRRVLGLLDGWFRSLAEPEPAAGLTGAGQPPAGHLARTLFDRARSFQAATDDLQLASFEEGAKPRPLVPSVQGGAGVVRLSAGGLSLELHAMGDGERPRVDRLAFRLGDETGPLLDGPPERAAGWVGTTSSRNVVVIDGLNQRETPVAARRPAPPGDILFHAADPTLQVASLSDPWAYPVASTLYRRTGVVVADPKTGVRYALTISEVSGGRQHDELVHAAGGAGLHWSSAGPGWEHGPPTLLPPSIVFLPDAPDEGGRWFVQAYGAFTDLLASSPNGPAQLVLRDSRSPRLRLHLLGLSSRALYLARSPLAGEEVPSSIAHMSLIARQQSEGTEPLSSTFVTLYEPISPSAVPLGRVGRFEAPEGVAGVVVETKAGVEYLVFNAAPGTERRLMLPDGKELKTDGLLIRVTPVGLTMAGGTFAEHGGRKVAVQRASGTIVSAMPTERTPDGLGWFVAEGEVPDPKTCPGLTLIIRHGDGRSRAWTIRRVEPAGEGRFRLLVAEEPGFTVDPATGEAEYYRFPSTRHPGPHELRIGRIAR